MWKLEIWQRVCVCVCVVTEDPDLYSIHSKESYINCITDHYCGYQFCFMYFWDQISGEWILTEVFSVFS